MVGIIASYPKSGNTWVRVFLNSYINECKEPISSLHSLGGITTGLGVHLKATGAWVGDLRAMSIEEFEKVSCKNFAKAIKASTKAIFKTHQNIVMNGIKQLPTEKIRTVYVLRDPVDVVNSMLRYFNIDATEAIHRLNTNTTMGRIQQMRYDIGSWSNHVLNWAYADNTLVVRYEDLVNHTFETFKSIVLHYGLVYNEEKIYKAIKDSELGTLIKKEKEGLFQENNLNAKQAFFSKTPIGKGYKNLTKDQINTIQKINDKVMTLYNYL